MIAFDAGPANGPLDEWIEAHTGRGFDEDGRIAAAGTVRMDVLTAMLDNPFFDAPPPKSLDRYDFSPAPARGLSLEDGAATLLAFSAAAVAEGAKHLPETPKEWIACGGGRKNPALMAALQKALSAPVLTAEQVGWRGDTIEAEAFAYLAVRSLAGAPLSFPGTTGVLRPTQGGVLTRAEAAA